MSKPGSIVLTMIVKNEEHVIERCLNSCYRLIDSYCIVDTGSTDKTKEIIKDFFDRKGITGKIIDFPFTNFEECRNLTIIEGKSLGEYGFWIDADEQLSLTDKFNKELFSASIHKNKLDQLTVKCQYNDLEYLRNHFYRFDAGYEWYGPVHEVLRHINTNVPINADKFKYGEIIIKPEGNSWKGDVSKKYKDHADILLKYQIDNNWKDPRWTFYLAQSYRDAYETLSIDQKDTEVAKHYVKECIKYYKLRTESPNPGYIEELYYSQLMYSRYNSFHMDKANTILNLTRCENFNVFKRIEHLFYISYELLELGQPSVALIFAEKAHSYLVKGTEATLFLNNDIYQWKMLDVYSVCLARTGRHKDAVNIMKTTLSRMKGLENTPDYSRILMNIKNNTK